jgi:glycerophosphoryl diester phosphodiesterase
MAKVFAHRGASAYAPENTMDAFRLAIEMETDGIELDVHMAKDGTLVVCHDFDISRTSNGSGLIKDMTFPELSVYNYRGQFDGPARYTIPALEEVLDLLKPTGFILNIEIKSGEIVYPGIEKKLVEEVARFGMGPRVIYSSFDHYCLRRLRYVDPMAKTGLLYGEFLYEPWRYAAGMGAFALHPPYRTLNQPGMVDDAHKAGVDVNVWTVDEKKDILRMYDMGVDGIITNRPDVAKEVIGKRR